MRIPDIYKDTGLYSSEDMFSPPAEQRLHVIRFELTQGCPWGRCTYCCGFDGIPFKEKSLPEYQDHVDKVFSLLRNPDDIMTLPRLGKNGGDLVINQMGIRRVFIGGGDALAVETPKLAEAISYTSSQFGRFKSSDYDLRSMRSAIQVHYSPTRVAIYGSTRSITSKTVTELKALRNAGLGLVYWGVESGSDDVLAYVNKGCTQADILQAADQLNSAGIDTSVMIMPGVGGEKYFGSHIRETAKVLSAMKPKFITFMGIDAQSETAYVRRMEKEVSKRTNRPLTNEGVVIQMAAIIERTSFEKGTRVGCFTRVVDNVGRNPLTFGQRTIRRTRSWPFFPSDQKRLSTGILKAFDILYLSPGPLTGKKLDEAYRLTQI